MENQSLAIAASFSLLPLHKIIDGWDFNRLTWNTIQFQRLSKIHILEVIKKKSLVITWLTSPCAYFTYSESRLPCFYPHCSLFPQLQIRLKLLYACTNLEYANTHPLYTHVAPTTSTQPHVKGKFCAKARCYRESSLSQWMLLNILEKRAVCTRGRPEPLFHLLLLQVR